MYVTGNGNQAWAVDARTGRRIWSYERSCRRILPPRSVAGREPRLRRARRSVVHGHARRKPRRPRPSARDRRMEAQADAQRQHHHGAARREDKVIVGVAGSDFATRGYIDAYDAQTGARLWRFYTIPLQGEPGGNTWPSDEMALRGGGGLWVTGSYDPVLNTVYVGTGNPNPRYYGLDRAGDCIRLRVACARCRHRQAALALSVHAARPARLGFRPHPGARRHHGCRTAQKSRDGGQSQLVLLHARS